MGRPAETRRRALRRGHRAEWWAAASLVVTGWRVVAIRHRNPLGEIDLIARKAGLVAIIEVKARSDVSAAVDAVSPSARRRIRAAADLWLSRQPDAATLSLRFDIIAVRPWRWPVRLADAF